MFNSIKSQISAICRTNAFTMKPGENYDTGLPGLTIEGLLGVEVNNRDTADLSHAGIEVKFSSKTSPITMYHLDPMDRPTRANKKLGRARLPGSVEKILNEYGYQDDQGRWVFYHLLRGGMPTTGERVNGFYVAKEHEHINIRHVDSDKPVARYAGDVIVNAMNSKMRRLILVEGRRKGNKVNFDAATMFRELRVSKLLNLIADGTIMIDFGMYYRENGSLRNRGVKFRVFSHDLPKLYRNAESIHC